MTIQELGSLGEFIAAVGVMFSLIYVGYQLQEGRKLARIESIEKRLDSWSTWRRLTIQDERLQQIWEKGTQTLQNLTQEEKNVFDGMMLEGWLIVTRQHFRATEMNDSKELNQAVRSARSLFDFGPGASEWWRADRQKLASPFREWVDEVLSDIEIEI